MYLMASIYYLWPKAINILRDVFKSPSPQHTNWATETAIKKGKTNPVYLNYMSCLLKLAGLYLQVK